MSEEKNSSGGKVSLSLPSSRIRKIIDVDDDIKKCSGAATFVIGYATELFIQYLVEQTQNITKAERKARRVIQYKDVANAVARVDCLEFLSDVVPRMAQLKNPKQRKLTADKTPIDNLYLQTNHNNDEDQRRLSDTDSVTNHEVNASVAGMELDRSDVEMASDNSKRGPGQEKH